MDVGAGAVEDPSRVGVVAGTIVEAIVVILPGRPGLEISPRPVPADEWASGGSGHWPSVNIDPGEAARQGQGGGSAIKALPNPFIRVEPFAKFRLLDRPDEPLDPPRGRIIQVDQRGIRAEVEQTAPDRVGQPAPLGLGLGVPWTERPVGEQKLRIAGIDREVSGREPGKNILPIAILRGREGPDRKPP